MLRVVNDSAGSGWVSGILWRVTTVKAHELVVGRKYEVEIGRVWTRGAFVGVLADFRKVTVARFMLLDNAGRQTAARADYLPGDVETRVREMTCGVAMDTSQTVSGAHMRRRKGDVMTQATREALTSAVVANAEQHLARARKADHAMTARRAERRETQAEIREAMTAREWTVQS